MMAISRLGTPAALRGYSGIINPTEETMANVYVEARPKGRPDHSPIADFVVEDHADHVLHTSKTQDEAIAWARKEGQPARRPGQAPQRQEEA
jgi:hypothetical protein